MSRATGIVCTIGLLFAWTITASGSASATSCANTEMAVTGLSQLEMENSIACRINEERTAHGLLALRPNADLREAALAHSSEMIAQSYFEHTSPAGVTFVDRILAAGYTQKARFWGVGENLIWGHGPLSTPEAVVTGWMTSPKHRANLLAPRFREIGIAAVVGTPEASQDQAGVTVTSEYGYRVIPKKVIPKKRRGVKADRARKR